MLHHQIAPWMRSQIQFSLCMWCVGSSPSPPPPPPPQIFWALLARLLPPPGAPYLVLAALTDLSWPKGVSLFALLMQLIFCI